jgi:hypothetical protein
MLADDFLPAFLVSGQHRPVGPDDAKVPVNDHQFVFQTIKAGL